MSDFAIHLCSFCGNKCKGKFCNYCTTADGRKNQLIAQLEIEKSRGKKSETLFGAPRAQTLAMYKIKDY